MSTRPSPAIGTDVGRFRLEAVLGRGGMGVVYRATDARLGRSVALKVLPVEYGDDEVFRARFLRESRLAASIDHPGVIPIYEAGDADGQLYIAMRYVDGTDLAGILRREGTLDPPRAMALVGQLAAALDAAHDRGLVHRDVKPSNTLVVGRPDAEHVYLSDFGLSKDVAGDSTLSAPGAVLGTVRYMAPETIRSGQADPRSDLYSLACVLVECLTGEPPFPGPSEAAVIYGHLEEAPPSVSRRRPELPQALDAVIARGLHKDPDRRWPTGGAFVDAARNALGGGRAPVARGFRRLAPVATLGAAALAAIIALAAGSGDVPRAASVAANAVAVIDPDEASLTAQVVLDGAPAAIASGAGAVWVSDDDRDVVSRLDVETRTIRQTIGVGSGPAGIATERDRVWVANRDDGTVSVISPHTNEVVQTIRVGRTADGICVGGGAVWVASPLDYAVVRLDPETGRRTATARLDAQPAQLACGPDVVWAISPSSGTVTEISARTVAPVSVVQVGRGASGLALATDALWVANPVDGTVSRVDQRRGAVTATVSVGAGDGPAHLAVTSDAVWVSSEFGGRLSRIDPKRTNVVETLEVGNRPQALAVVDEALWLGVADAGFGHRGGTLKVDFVEELTWEELDPALGYGLGLLSLTNDGLTAWRRQGGAAGANVVANLAEALPVPSDGGRTYAFRLRRGLAYSSGEPVLASHVRFSLERAVRQGQLAAEYFASIRGARSCTPERCDLSRGIVTDDGARTVVFHLTEPDADLPHKLALPFASVLPPSVGDEAPARRLLPATGPYRITEFAPARSIVRLERNPRFASWSTMARPDGYPDAVIGRSGVAPRDAVERVLAGEVDVFNNLAEHLPGEMTRLRRRVPAQHHESVAPFTFYFVLNTRRPPFDRVSARRAVAFAFDRRAAVAAAGGADVARETCQLLPPGFPGSRPYCPYTVRGTGGARGRPDLAQARRLVKRSGTRGMRVTVLGLTFLPRLPRLMTTTLRKLGYDASLRLQPLEEHFSTLMDTSKNAQIGLVPWIADYPAPSTFLENFSCDAIKANTPDNLNPSQFCDREVDRLMAEAARVQAIDPSAADPIWARAERRIVDQAPAVAAFNRVWTNLVSERLGNYQYSPLYGMLLDQAWVR